MFFYLSFITKHGDNFSRELAGLEKYTTMMELQVRQKLSVFIFYMTSIALLVQNSIPLLLLSLSLSNVLNSLTRRCTKMGSSKI